MAAINDDEWGVVKQLLPTGWEEAARSCGAFRRARYLTDPQELLRLLLFHAINGTGLRETAAQAKTMGLADMSQVALLKRLRTSGDWLAWIAEGLARGLGVSADLPGTLRVRVVDSTTVQGPASKGTQWRLHYAMDLLSLHGVGFCVTDAHGGERLERTPMAPGDVLLADRNYFRAKGVALARDAGAHVVIRMRWTHPPLRDAKDRPFDVLARCRSLKVNHVGSWPVTVPIKGAKAVQGRVVAVRLPAPLAAKNQVRAERQSLKKGKIPDPRSLQAAKFVLLFTTLPESLMSAENVLELYRHRWQIELAFKRMKQLLRLGQLPHKDPAAARTWILAKLVVSLLLETLIRNARTFSPWGYDLRLTA